MTNGLLSYRNQEFSLEELVGELRSLLRTSVPSPQDGRVTDIPDARTLRYYQTTGLLDKPVRYDGRKAVYGYRHLLQVLSLKLLQAQGFSLAQIQRALTGASRDDLERAVAESLGEGDIPVDIEAVAAEAEPAAVKSKALIAVAVGRGVSIVIDPTEVKDPEVILAAVTELMNVLQGGTE
jgi:DNA-binding transcriptional MerR regulator